MLYNAMELMPPAEFQKLVEPYFELETLRSDSNPPESLLARVTSFTRASLAGDYYEDFSVDSTNDLTKSTSTVAWIAECNRLLKSLRGRRG